MITPFLLHPDKSISNSNFFYYLFEHFKVELFCMLLFIENVKRYWFLPFVFGVDAFTFCLNYGSTWIEVYDFPVGVDLIKVLALFVIVIFDEWNRMNKVQDSSQ